MVLFFNRLANLYWKGVFVTIPLHIAAFNVAHYRDYKRTFPYSRRIYTENVATYLAVTVAGSTLSGASSLAWPIVTPLVALYEMETSYPKYFQVRK